MKLIIKALIKNGSVTADDCFRYGRNNEDWDGFSKRKVIDHLEVLTKSGWIVKDDKKGKDNFYNEHYYKLPLIKR